MNSELSKGRCPRSRQTFILKDPFGTEHTCPFCIPAQLLRSHMVWFGEMPIVLDKIQYVLAICYLFSAIGISGTVYHAAGFVGTVNHHVVQTIEVNLVESNRHGQFQYHLQGKQLMVEKSSKVP